MWIDNDVCDGMGTGRMFVRVGGKGMNRCKDGWGWV